MSPAVDLTCSNRQALEIKYEGRARHPCGIAAKKNIGQAAFCSRCLNGAFIYLKQCHVECAASQIKDKDVDRVDTLLVESIRDRSRCGLVDDSQDIQAGNLAGILRRLPLVVVEVRRDLQLLH